MTMIRAIFETKATNVNYIYCFISCHFGLFGSVRHSRLIECSWSVMVRPSGSHFVEIAPQINCVLHELVHGHVGQISKTLYKTPWPAPSKWCQSLAQQWRIALESCRRKFFAALVIAHLDTFRQCVSGLKACQFLLSINITAKKEESGLRRYSIKKSLLDLQQPYSIHRRQSPQGHEALGHCQNRKEHDCKGQKSVSQDHLLKFLHLHVAQSLRLSTCTE